MRPLQRPALCPLRPDERGPAALGAGGGGAALSGLPRRRGGDRVEASDGRWGQPGMTRAIPFTAASLARAIKGVERAGRFVIGVRPDGTLIVGEKPVETPSLAPAIEEQ